MNFDNQELQFPSKFTALEMQSIQEIKNTSASEMRDCKGNFCNFFLSRYDICMFNKCKNI